MSTASPSRPLDSRDSRRRAWLPAAVSAALLLYGTFVLAPDEVAGWYVPLNLAAAGALVLWARRLGLSRAGIGFDNWDRGLVWGLAISLGAAVVLALGVALPATRGLFDDARLAGVGAAGFLYRGLVRIPLGTALLEEVAFRGVLFGLWQRWRGTLAAAAGSSLVFGLWHIRPTMDLLAANDLASQPLVKGVAVAGAVVVTALGGLFFCYMRIRSGSLLAPFLAHAAINSFATGAAWVAMSIG